MEGLEPMIYDRNYKDGDLDMYNGMQLPTKETRFHFFWPKSIIYETPPGLDELNDISNDFKGSVEHKTDE